MKNIFVATCLTVVVFASACVSDEEIPTTRVTEEDCFSSSSINNGNIVENEFIVKLASGGATGNAQVRMASIAKQNLIDPAAVLSTIDAEKGYLTMKLSSIEAANLGRHAEIERVEPERIVSICGCFSVVEPRTVTWNVNQVGYGDGTDKTAWIIDTGIDSDHPDLRVDKARSKSFVDGSSFEDDNGHGTHVAGIIGALNNNTGTLGVASGATVVALKVLDADGEGKLSSVLNALAHIRSNGKAGDVVNISIGFDDTSAILEEEIKSIASRGIYFALAAGNNSGDVNNYSPARASGKNVFTVSAVDSLKRFADFSNYGRSVDFAAPGVGILSTYTNGRFAILSGTSQAAPHVAGLLLLNNGKVNSNGAAGSDPDGSPDPLAHK